MLDRVGEALAGDEVGGGLEPAVEPLTRRLHLDPDRHTSGELAKRRTEPSVELGWRESVRELAQFVDRERHFGERAVERDTGALGRGRAELVLCVTQRQPDRDEPLLGSVVEIALQPPSLLVAGRDDSEPRGLDLGKLTTQSDV